MSTRSDTLVSRLESRWDEWANGWRAPVGAQAGMPAGLYMFVTVTGFFVKPLGGEFGWSRGQIAMLAVAPLATSLLLPVVGAIADRRGIRHLVGLGALTFAVCYAAMALMTGPIWQYYTMLAAVALIGGPCTIPLIFCRPVVQAFDRSRGLALAVAQSGVPVLSFLLLPMLQHVIATEGWRAAAAYMSPITLVLGLTAFMLFGNAARSKLQEPAVAPAARPSPAIGLSLRQALADPRFWLLALSMIGVNFIVGVMITSLQPMLADEGVDGASAALLAVEYLVAVLVGRLTIGTLLDYFPAARVGCLAFGAPLIGLSLFLLAGSSLPLLGLAIVLIAIPDGSETAILSYLTSRFFGLRAFGAITCVLGSVCSAAFALGALLAGRTFDLFGNYRPILMAGLACAVVASLSVLAAGSVKRNSHSAKTPLPAP